MRLARFATLTLAAQQAYILERDEHLLALDWGIHIALIRMIRPEHGGRRLSSSTRRGAGITHPADVRRTNANGC